MDSAVGMVGIGERSDERGSGLSDRARTARCRSAPGAYFGSHSTVSQSRADRAAREALLVPLHRDDDSLAMSG
jgi:hypothetical protein